MKFDELEQKMRVFETASDLCVLPEMYMVARLDGRGFTRLTKKVCEFEAPYDVRFRDLMIDTVQSLMQCGFDVVYAYTQSDEISLLFNRTEKLFGRKLRKFNSVLAAQASSRFSIALATIAPGQTATFDCRISQLPNAELVVDYFRWRQQDALRNALNAHCYWALRKSGVSAKQATRQLTGLKVSEKNELLFSRFGVNFNKIPAWQKRGVGLNWQTYQKSTINRLTGDPVQVTRRRINVVDELPMKDEYSKFVGEMC